MDSGKIIETLVDRPLYKEDRKYLVNREKELGKIELLAKYQPFGIYGVCGETGIGKTTVLNMLNFKGMKVLMVTLTQRDNKDTILYDLLYSLSDLLAGDDDSELSEFSQTTRSWIVEEVSVIKAFSLGVSLFAKADGMIQNQKKPRYNIFSARERLSQLLNLTKKAYGKVLLIIDELDKEEKKDVINVLDSLKVELQQEHIVTFFSLPYSIYREYRQDRMRWNDSGNLENIIKDVVFLREIKRSEVREVLLRRLGKLSSWFESGAVEEIVRFSDGNPRDALWIAQKVVFDNFDLKKLSEKACGKSIKKIVNEYMGAISLTDIQRKALVSVKELSGSRDEIIDAFVDESIKRTTAYSTFKRLVTLGLIIERDGQFVVSGKARAFINDHSI